MIQLYSALPDISGIQKENIPEKALQTKNNDFENMLYAAARKQDAGNGKKTPPSPSLATRPQETGTEPQGRGKKSRVTEKNTKSVKASQTGKKAELSLREKNAADKKPAITGTESDEKSQKEKIRNTGGLLSTKGKTDHKKPALKSGGKEESHIQAASKGLQDSDKKEILDSLPEKIQKSLLSKEEATEDSVELPDMADSEQETEGQLVKQDGDFPPKAFQQELKTKTPRKAINKKESLKISIEDKRTKALASEENSLFKKVKGDEAASKLSLELHSDEKLSALMQETETLNDNSGKPFSLQGGQEQKGAGILDRQLQEKGNLELAKNIKFVLKDNKEGEIKLILKPEALGKVRIKLNLHENNIVGRIIVENQSVRQTFLNNLADLTKALEDSGFDTASLDVSVGGGQAESREQREQGQPRYYFTNALDYLEGQIPVIYEDGVSSGQINLVV